MADATARTSTRIDPGPAWTVVTDAPLKGLDLAREAGLCLAWDEADQLYLLDLEGQTQSISRAPGKILSAAISDDAGLIALLGEGNRLWMLGPDFELIQDREAITDAISLTVDPHGRYVAVASKLSLIQFYNRFGKMAGKFETRQPMGHMVFVPDQALLYATGAVGTISAFELSTKGSKGQLTGDLSWNEALLSNVGRLATVGDGSAIFIACYTHGVQRFDAQGRNEGAYHLGGSASIAVPDFLGRIIAVATMESGLAILSGNGNVRWQATLPRPAVALDTDPLGRFIVYGLGTGEITRLDLQRGRGPRSADRPLTAAVARPDMGPNLDMAGPAARAGGASVVSPAWTVPLVNTEDQAEFTVLAVSDDPPRVGAVTTKNRLEIYTTDGKKLGAAPEILGVGRMIRTSPGWMAAATDRQIVLCDLNKNTAQRVDLSLVETTHLAIQPDGYGLAIVQERDRVGRATVAGRWIWKSELKTPVEDLAIGPEGFTAYTTEDGRLCCIDPAGNLAGEFRADLTEPLYLIEAPAGSPKGVVWVTLGRRAEILRGHDLKGRAIWESPVPWEAWQLHRVGGWAVVVAPDGRTLAFDGAGHGRAQGKTETAQTIYGPGPDGLARRVSRSGVHLICTEIDGQVIWRSIAPATLGPLAAGRSGVAALIGKDLAWFPSF